MKRGEGMWTSALALAVSLGLAAPAGAANAVRWPLDHAAKGSQAHATAASAATAAQTTTASSTACSAIPDDAYDGSLASMVCRAVPGYNGAIQSLKLRLGVTHSFVGDLVVKVVDPAGKATTVLSRPGLAESADDGNGCCGDGSGLSAANSLVFDDAASASAEDMGASTDDSGVICRDDGNCVLKPAAGAATPGTLADYAGSNGAGTWKVCVGDAESLETGSLCSAALVFNGQESDLGIAADFPQGTQASGSFPLRLAVSDHGPVGQTGVVATDMLPSSLQYVSDDCGASVNGSLITWNLGDVAANTSRECHVQVRAAQSGTCEQVTTTATVRGDVADPYAANDSATAQNGGDNLVSDPGLETSGPSGGGIWASTSTNFGTVFCAQGRCTDNPTERAYAGDWWGWFGGVDPDQLNGATLPETGRMSQTLSIPPEVDTLYFHLRLPQCSGSAADYLALTVDGHEVWRVDASNASLCGAMGYSQQAVDIAAYADGTSHTLAFTGVETGQAGISTFFVDNVAFIAPVVCTDAAGPDDRLFAAGFDGQ